MSRGFDSRRRSVALLATLALLASAFGLAVSDRAQAVLYWEGDHSIQRVNFDGSHRSDRAEFSAGILLSTGAGFIQTTGGGCGMAVTSTHIYWTDRFATTIGRANIDGSEPKQDFITGASTPCGLAVDGNHIYWANREANAIGRADLDGSNVEQRFIPGIPYPCGVAVGGGHLFWSDPFGKEIGRANLDGSSIESSFLAGTESPCYMAADDKHVFWGNIDSGTIGRAELDGQHPEDSFVKGADRPCGLAVSGNRLFWANDSLQGGSIGSATVDGADVNESYVTDVGLPCGVAADSSYFAPPPPPASSFGFGRVRRSAGAVAFLAINLPSEGQVAVGTTNGVAWRFVPGEGPAMSAGRKWLRLAPAGQGWDAHNLRRQLRNRGRLRVRVTVTYSEIQKTAIARTRFVTLVRRPAVRR